MAIVATHDRPTLATRLAAGIACVVAVSFVNSARAEGPEVIQAIELGDSVTGSLAGADAVLTLEGSDGTPLRLSVAAAPTLGLSVGVFGPDGSPALGMPDWMPVQAGGLDVIVDLVDGLHSVVLRPTAGTSGSYTLETGLVTSPRQRESRQVLFEGEQTVSFAAHAGTQLRSLTLRGARGLSFAQPGVLLAPSGAEVAFKSQKAKGRLLQLRKALLTEDGLYTFRFTPAGTGTLSSDVKLKAPRAPAAVTEWSVSTSGPASPPPAVGPALSLSVPANGSHFVPGERPHVFVVLRDADGLPVEIGDVSSLNLYLYGPQEQSLTTTPVGLLRASADRNARPHHYIDLRAAADQLRYDGNVVCYQLGAITDELPGTYSAVLRVTRASDALQQWMPVVDFQIGSAAVESQLVDAENCARCHRGAANGQFYLRHVDPGSSGVGSPAIDSWPVRTCKACHNQDGYAAYRNGGSSGNANADRTPDPIIRRVHGVHMGKGLKSVFNADPSSGDFADYIDVVFPADVRNCSTCHIDDRWETNVSTQACTACHDNVWFGATGAMPADFELHSGGQQSDANCKVCHKPTGVSPVAARHDTTPAAPDVDVVLSMSAPKSGAYYTAGDAPVASVVLKQHATGATIDHLAVNETTYNRVYVFVSGPRSATRPVLTTAALGTASARASLRNATNGPWDLSGDPTFVVDFGGAGARTITAFASLFANPAAATMSEVIAWFNSAAPNGLGDLATASAYTSGGSSKVTLRSNGRGETIEILASAVATQMGYDVGVVEPSPSSYARNDVRQRTDPFDADPKASWFQGRIDYQLDDVSALEPGTYTLFVTARPQGGATSYGILNFQVGTAAAEPKVATNCTDCHAETRMHGSYAFDTDICKNCHDYAREGTGDGWSNFGGTTTSGWAGFGAMPISRRLHGVHRGRYLEYPEQVKPAPYDFSEVIFPQDIRNCVKCHAESPSWTEKPSRLACLACHDDDAAQAHGRVMTYDPTPLDPWSGDEMESCQVCHGDHGDLAPSVVHNVWDPYVPPYRREPSGH